LNTFRNRNIDQEELVALLRCGDRKGMELLYDHYSSSVFGLAFVITKSESASEKILKETFLYAWKHHSTFNQTYQDFGLWLLGIARKIAQAQTSFDDFLKNHVETDFVSKTGINLETMERRMTGVQKKVFDLVFFGGGTICDVARHLSMDEQNVKQLLHEAVNQYRKELEQA
jgi:DNA-directed RNA polymerase specialized sigma24 family protein